MFKMFSQEPTKIQPPAEKSIAQEMRDKAIENLHKGIQNENNPLKVRIKEAEALITLLNEKLSLEGNTLLKIDLTEAETYKAELERDFHIQSEQLTKKRAA